MKSLNLALSRLLWFPALALLAFGCATHRDVSVPGFAMDQYHTLVFVHPDTQQNSPLYGVDIEFGNKLVADGFRIVGEKTGDTLSGDSQTKTLLVKTYLHITARRSIVSATFTHYQTGQPVLSVTEVVKGDVSSASDLANISEALYQAVKKRLEAEAETKKKTLADMTNDRIALRKAEDDAIKAKAAEVERLAVEKAEAERLAKDRAEADKLLAEKAAADKAEAERLAKEQAKNNSTDEVSLMNLKKRLAGERAAQPKRTIKKKVKKVN